MLPSAVNTHTKSSKYQYMFVEKLYITYTTHQVASTRSGTPSCLGRGGVLHLVLAGGYPCPGVPLTMTWVPQLVRWEGNVFSLSVCSPGWSRRGTPVRTPSPCTSLHPPPLPLPLPARTRKGYCPPPPLPAPLSLPTRHNTLWTGHAVGVQYASCSHGGGLSCL